jgi:hypothetical protein
MDLGIQSGAPLRRAAKAATSMDIVSTPSTVHVLSGQRTEPETQSATQDLIRHPRYAISIMGCSSSVYNVIAPDQQDTYARLLLISEDLFDEHPRQDPLALELLRSMKPSWSYETFNDESVSPTRRYTISEEQEGVVVGEYTGGDDDDDEL